MPLWQTWHSLQMFLLLFLVGSSVELMCLSSHLSRAVGWWCWVWCLAAGTGVSCPGLGTGREAWMSQVSLEALDFLPLVNWDTQTSLRLGLAEKGWPQVFRTAAYLFNQRRLSLWKTFMGVECVSYPAHCSLCEGIIASCPSSWKASLAIERLWLQTEKEWHSDQSIYTGLKKWLSKHLIYQVVSFTSKTNCIYQLLRVMAKSHAQWITKYLIILWRIGLRGSRGELYWIVRSRGVLAHERHPTGWVRRWRGASLLWTSGVLQRLGRIPWHATRTILLHWKTLGKWKVNNGRHWGYILSCHYLFVKVRTVEGPWCNQRYEKACNMY